jgi:hypothetical protein
MARKQPLYLRFLTIGAPQSLAVRSNIERALIRLGQETDCLAIVDIHDRLDLAVQYGVFVTPTLLLHEKAEQRLIGDLSDTVKLMAFLQK